MGQKMQDLSSKRVWSTKDQEKKQLGQAGEEAAVRFLEARGYRILERNYRCRLGEIDLIAEKKKERAILFIEVKTRRAFGAVSPLELVPYGKQYHISRVAQHYVTAKKCQDIAADFALLVVDWSGKRPLCELIENAFPLTWGY